MNWPFCCAIFQERRNVKIKNAKPKRGAPLLFAVKLRRVLVTLDEGTIKRATKLGDGNLSAGIRKALARD